MKILAAIRAFRFFLLSVMSAMLAMFTVSCDSDRMPAFSISPAVTELQYSPDGKTIFSGTAQVGSDFAVSTNQDDWSVELSEPDSWLSVKENEGSFTLSAEVNIDMDGRGPITLTVKSGNADDIVIEVTQLGVSSTLPTLYFAGRYAVMSEDDQCAYLKDGELGILGKSGDLNTVITGVAAGSSDIYLSGYVTEDGNVSGLYWKGAAKEYLLQDGNPAYPGNVFVSGSDSYVAGTDYYTSEENGKELYDVVYWKNGSKNILAKGMDVISQPDLVVSNIAVSGKDTHIVRLESRSENGQGTRSLVYWKNDEMSVIEEGSQGLISDFGIDMAVSGDDVYISGNLSAGGVNYGGYWKNGDFTRIQVEGNDVTVKAIDAEGKDVYIIGSYTDGTGNRNFLWKNGEVTIVKADPQVSGYSVEIYDVAVHDGRAFVSGVEGDFNIKKGNACYWIDGVTKVVVEVPLTAGIFIPEFVAVKK